MCIQLIWLFGFYVPVNSYGRTRTGSWFDVSPEDLEKLGVEHMAMFCLTKLHHRGFF